MLAEEAVAQMVRLPPEEQGVAGVQLTTKQAKAEQQTRVAEVRLALEQRQAQEAAPA